MWRRLSFASLVVVAALLTVWGVARGLSPGTSARSPHPGAAERTHALRPGRPAGRTYYVRSRGSDRSSGVSPRTAWRTTRRVNDARLVPGDRVLFEGGAVFGGGPLAPRGSGRPGAPIVFGSSGARRARLDRGVRLVDAHWLSFTDLAISKVPQAITGSAAGGGSTNVVLEGNAFTDVGIAVNAANARDRSWVLRDNLIERTGDSGVILLGRSHKVSGNTILETGTDLSIPYAKHGIYLKSSDSRVSRNTIRGFEAEGVSSRLRNAVIDRNAISEGQIGLAWYQNGRPPGKSIWRNNRISDTTKACLYVSGADSAGRTRESFVISGNRLSKRSGVLTNFERTSGYYQVSDDQRIGG